MLLPKFLMLAAGGLLVGIFGAFVWEKTESGLVTNHFKSATESINSQTDSKALLASLQEEEDRADEEEALAILAEIDNMTAHPDDPQKPADIVGVTDKYLEAHDADQIKDLIESAYPYATSSYGKPRHLFGLGRAALLHGFEETGRRLLIEAAQNGSPAAVAYLALLEEDHTKASEMLKRSAQNGFIPAIDWLEEIEEEQREQSNQSRMTGSTNTSPVTQHSQPLQNTSPAASINYNSFLRPDIIRALYEGDFDFIQSNKLINHAYLMQLNDIMSDSQALMITENPDIVDIVDPSLSTLLSYKLIGDPGYTKEVIETGITTLEKIFIPVIDSRNSGGSPMDEIAAIMQGMSKTPLVGIEVIQQQATADGRRLIKLFETNRPVFKQIYNNFRRYVNK